MTDRRAQIAGFLAATDWSDASLAPLAGDASARRYYRLHHRGRSAVLMDAPPGTDTSTTAFLTIAEWLTKAGFSAPLVLHQNPSIGLLLIEDFGDALFANLTSRAPDRELSLYRAATDVLISLDAAPAPDLPHFSAATMSSQIDLLFDWYATGLNASFTPLEKTAIQAALETALHTLAGPNTILLRDFHAENLIWLPDRVGIARVGLLDFQDAMIGPAGYDLVSLLWDARRDVSQATIDQMVQHFADATGRSLTDTQTAFAVIGLQRNLRILGIFARLCLRDGKSRYIDFIPRVYRYVQTSLRHPSLADLNRMLATRLPEPTPQNLDRLRQQCATAPTR